MTSITSFFIAFSWIAQDTQCITAIVVLIMRQNEIWSSSLWEKMTLEGTTYSELQIEIWSHWIVYEKLNFVHQALGDTLGHIRTCVYLSTNFQDVLDDCSYVSLRHILWIAPDAESPWLQSSDARELLVLHCCITFYCFLKGSSVILDARHAHFPRLLLYVAWYNAENRFHPYISGRYITDIWLLVVEYIFRQPLHSRIFPPPAFCRILI